MALAVVVTPTDGFSQGAQVAVGTREPQQQVSDAVLDVPVGVPDLAVVVDSGGAPYLLRVAPYSAAPVIEYPALPGYPLGIPQSIADVGVLDYDPEGHLLPAAPDQDRDLTGRRRVRHGIGLTAQLLRLIQAPFGSYVLLGRLGNPSCTPEL